MKLACAVIYLVTAALCPGADLQGLRPRSDRTDYAVTMFNDLLAVAAELVPAEKVQKLFGAEVGSRYIVVEVGVYPRIKNPIEVRPGDFAIHVTGSRDMLSPQVPKTISEVTQSLRSIAADLLSKCLPDISTYKPVAGYLYFPAVEGKNDYELEYKARNTWMILPFHAVAAK